MFEAVEKNLQNELVELSGLKFQCRDGIYSEKIVEALRNGSYESGERNVVPRLVQVGDRVLEIGSAMGCVSSVTARIVGEQNIISYEANPCLIDDARANFALNNISLQVKNGVLKNRVDWGGDGETVDFFVHREFWASSLKRSDGTILTCKVPTFCLEKEARNFGANTLICDIEGGEIELLTLADLSGFDKILMEIHYWAGRESVNRLIRKLIFDGFSVNFDLSFGSIVTLMRGLSV